VTNALFVRCVGCLSLPVCFPFEKERKKEGKGKKRRGGTVFLFTARKSQNIGEAVGRGGQQKGRGREWWKAAGCRGWLEVI
jgi:hypothetical protein